MTTATVRDLRTKFPKVRHLIETSGEVVVTVRGKLRFVLRPYRITPSKKLAATDFYKRLRARMPKMLTEAQSRAIDQLDRGER